MRRRWEDLKAAVREFVKPTWAPRGRPRPGSGHTAARTRWVRDHRHPDGGTL